MYYHNKSDSQSYKTLTHITITVTGTATAQNGHQVIRYHMMNDSSKKVRYHFNPTNVNYALTKHESYTIKIGKNVNKMQSWASYVRVIKPIINTVIEDDEPSYLELFME